MRTGSKAAIYARVSTKRQVQQGNGLNSQISSCREYCRQNDFEVVETFTDDSTGGSDNREGLKDLKNWIKENRKDSIVIVVDAISRVARDVAIYQNIKRYATDHGAIFRSPTFTFEDSPAGRFMETIHVGMGQFEREDNAARVKRCQKARLSDGYWCLAAPIGYRSAGKGKPIEPDDLSGIVREALEGFASGRFETAASAKRFVEAQPEFIATRKSPVLGNGRMEGMLRNPLYAGYIDYPKWSISLRKGKHKPLISYQTFQLIQERLDGNSRVHSGKETSEDFPLRGFVLCDDCGRPLTAGWSRSKSGKMYPYYRCFNKRCDRQGKSINGDKLEAHLVSLLSELQPHETVAKVMKRMLRDLWEHNQAATLDRRRDLERQIKLLQQEQEKLLDRIVETENDSVASAYEKRIAQCQKKQVICKEKLSDLGKSISGFDEMFEHTLKVISTPCDIWKKESYEWRIAVLKVVFSERLRYCHKSGLRTPETTFPFKVLRGEETAKDNLAEAVSAHLVLRKISKHRKWP
ncbi:recombinase [Thalassococcus profundi]|uniref:Recombinase n=1 Tax=Thalassococcus profundi TaxID=2282382 RepID=A0A369TQL7_9RHOB|nr:recombinase family protein [Thalassococcus profundi]RDD67182.1 recombinase [Thalassococcus profundi]